MLVCCVVVPATRALLLALALGGAGDGAGMPHDRAEPLHAVRGLARVAATATRAQYRSWETSDHHLAMLAASPDAALRAHPHDDGPMVVRDGQLAMLGKSLDHDSDVALAYALGHRNVEQYVGPLAPGQLQALPLAFDVQRGEWFDLFAGESAHARRLGPLDQPRHDRQRPVPRSATPPASTRATRQASDTYDTRWAEMGVGCEACHGPGAAHVRSAHVGRRRSMGRTRSRAPARGLRRAVTAVASSARRGRPAEPFLDAFEPELFDTDAYYPDGQVREELYELVSFQSSRMYAEGVRCWNCHDPHGNGTLKPGNEHVPHVPRKTYEDEAHTHHPAGSAGAQCTGCHMPVTVYMQRDPRHDHSFGRPDPELTLALGVPNACNRCHADHDAAWAAEHVRAWYPDDAVRAQRRAVATATIAERARAAIPDSVPGLLALLGRPGRRGPSRQRRAPARSLPDQHGRHARAARRRCAIPSRSCAPAPPGRSRSVRRSRPTRATPSSAHSTTRCSRSGCTPPSGCAASRPTRSRPSRPRRRSPRATAEWRTSQELGADTPEAHYNLAIVLGRPGPAEEAEREYRAALRLWPRSIQARHNLAMLLAQQGRPDEAAAELETLLANDPVPASAFALGLLYGQMGRWNDAARGARALPRRGSRAIPARATTARWRSPRRARRRPPSTSSSARPRIPQHAPKPCARWSICPAR